MKRLFLALVVLTLIVTACGSPDEVEPSSAESSSNEDDSIETKVAATVAAALGQNTPTEPAISGNATPLTPIPQLSEDTAIEVSPEVEYADEGRQDGVLMFDFGGEGAAEPSGSTQTGASAAPLGGTAFNSVGSVAVTLRNAQFVESFTTPGLSPQVITPEAGYRLLWLRYERMNLGPNLHLPEYYGGQVLDRDNDVFDCAVYPAEQKPRQTDLILPGFGQPYDSLCRIPVTAAAEELVGLRAVIGNNVAVDPIFDLGSAGGVPVDFSTSRPTPTTLPASSTDFCPENTDWPYRLEEARWYDTPSAQPPDEILAAAAEWSGESSTGNWAFDAVIEHQFRQISSVETSEDRRAVVIRLWQETWAPYDLTDMDVIAIDIITTNLGKQPGASPILARSFAAFDADDPLSPFALAGYSGNADRFSSLLLPFDYLTLMMPPGAEQRTTLFGIVPENADSIEFVHLFNCAGQSAYGDSNFIVFQVPRQPLTPNEAMSAAGAQPVTVPENLRHMVDAGAVQVVVDAGQARTYSGIMVEANQTVSFAYLDGRWRGGPAADWPMVNSQGDMRVCRKATFPDPDGCLMGLIWGVGESGVSGTIGINPFGTVTSTGGELWFGPNDDNFSDNAGSVAILVQLQ